MWSVSGIVVWSLGFVEEYVLLMQLQWQENILGYLFRLGSMCQNVNQHATSFIEKVVLSSPPPHPARNKLIQSKLNFLVLGDIVKIVHSLKASECVQFENIFFILW